MELSFKLEKFEGPMDLLLHLIDKNKVDIMDIPIAQITDQYFEVLDQMEQTDMDIMSDFLVMAATLLDIKARLLLPPKKDEEGQEIDPRTDLVQQLLEYKMYKYMSYELRGREEDALMVLYHDPDIPKEVKSYREPVDLDLLLKDVTLQSLQKVFNEVMKRAADRVDPIRSSFGKVEKDPVDTVKVRRNVEKNIMSRKRCSFRSLLTQSHSRMYMVVTFLTILELMKMGRVAAEQDDLFGEIMITARDRSEWNSDYPEEAEPEDFD